MLHYFPPCELGLVNIVSSVSPLLRKFASLDFLLVPKWNASSQRCYLCRLTNWITILPNVATKSPRKEHGWLLHRGPLVLSIVCLLYRNYFLLTAVVRSCYWNGSKRRSVNLFFSKISTDIFDLNSFPSQSLQPLVASGNGTERPVCLVIELYSTETVPSAHFIHADQVGILG